MPGWEQTTVYGVLAVAVVTLWRQLIVERRSYDRKNERQMKIIEKLTAAFDRLSRLRE